MSRFRYLLTSLIAASVAVSMASPVHAQAPDETGIVRVTDSPEIGQEMQASTEPCPNCPSGGYVSDCPQCPGYGPCGGHCRLGRKVHQILDWFNPYGMCTFSPDHGWAPPTKQRIYRQSVAYQKQFPDKWTGYQGGYGYDSGYRAPTVYMPTDTTQLGYYYQHAPRWWPYQGMIPPTPHPADWHVISACGQGCQTCQHGNGGEVVESYPAGTEYESMPADSGHESMPAEPTPAQDVTQPTPAGPGVPPSPSALEKADATPQLQQIQ